MSGGGAAAGSSRLDYLEASHTAHLPSSPREPGAHPQQQLVKRNVAAAYLILQHLRPLPGYPPPRLSSRLLSPPSSTRPPTPPIPSLCCAALLCCAVLPCPRSALRQTLSPLPLRPPGEAAWETARAPTKELSPRPCFAVHQPRTRGDALRVMATATQLMPSPTTNGLKSSFSPFTDSPSSPLPTTFAHVFSHRCLSSPPSSMNEPALMETDRSSNASDHLQPPPSPYPSTVDPSPVDSNGTSGTEVLVAGALSHPPR